MNILSISQFGFSAYFGSPKPPTGAVVGWTSVNSNNVLASVPNASSSMANQLFNAYFFQMPPNTAGSGFILQCLANGKYVAAQTATVNGASQTVFAATGETQADAAQFGLFQLNANVSFFWQNPADKQWYGLVNLATSDFGGNGVVAASSIQYAAPYLLPWQSAQTTPNWTFTAPAGWNVAQGSDLSWVDFTCIETTRFAFDFTRCRLFQTNLTGKSFGYAKFVGCDLSTTAITPPLGASDTAWIDFTGATINYPSLGPDWRFLNLTKAVINEFPAEPTPPPKINARGAILDYLNMIQWNLNGADFTGASMCNANLSGSYLAGAIFHGAILSPIGGTTSQAVPANLAYSYLFDADFSNANLQGVNFAYAFLFGKSATLSGASLREADFSNAFLPEANFSGIYQKDLVGVGFDGACLAGANFEGTILGKVNTLGFSFVGAALQGVDFTGSNLEGANLTNAAIAVDAPPPNGNQLAITAVFKLGSISIPLVPITYTQATILAITDNSTYCPSGTGPCQGPKLQPSDPSKCPLKSWPLGR